MVRSLILPSLLLLAPLATITAQVPQAGIDRAIEKGVEYLKAQQKDDGTWETYKYRHGVRVHNSGPTALAVLAMLKSGVRPDDEAVKKGIAQVAGASLDYTYDTSVRCMMFQALCESRWKLEHQGEPSIRGKGHRCMLRSAEKRALRACASSIWTSSRDGEWGYLVRSRTTTTSKDSLLKKATQGLLDSSNTQYAILGLRAAADCDIQAPGRFWNAVIEYWLKTQEKRPQGADAASGEQGIPPGLAISSEHVGQVRTQPVHDLGRCGLSRHRPRTGSQGRSTPRSDGSPLPTRHRRRPGVAGEETLAHREGRLHPLRVREGGQPPAGPAFRQDRLVPDRGEDTPGGSAP